jgi:hypothetical protein
MAQASSREGSGWRGGALLLAGIGLAWAVAGAQTPSRIGGCRTTERDFGPPGAARVDSAAALALDELTAPGPDSKVGPACRRLGVDTPLFVSLGAVDPIADTLWTRAVERVDSLLRRSGAHRIAISPLRHTTGPCFPPYHVEMPAVGDSASVAAFLRGLPMAPWGPFVATPERGARILFVSAGTSRQSMDTVVDLRMR